MPKFENHENLAKSIKIYAVFSGKMLLQINFDKVDCPQSIEVLLPAVSYPSSNSGNTQIDFNLYVKQTKRCVLKFSDSNGFIFIFNPKKRLKTSECYRNWV